MKLQSLFQNMTFGNIEPNCFETTEQLENPETAKMISGMANGSGGSLFFGASGNGDVIGCGLESLSDIRSFMENLSVHSLNKAIPFGVSMRSVDEYAEKYVFCVTIQKSPETVLLKANETTGAYYVFDKGTLFLKGPNESLNESNPLFHLPRWSSFVSRCPSLPSGEDSIVSRLSLDGLIDKQGIAEEGFDIFSDGYEGNFTRIVCRLVHGNQTQKESRLFEGSFFSSLSSCVSFLEALFENRRIFYPVDSIKRAILLCYQLRDYANSEASIVIEISTRELLVSCPSKAYLLIDASKIKTPIFGPINEIILKCFRLLYGKPVTISDLVDSEKDSCEIKAGAGNISFVFTNTLQPEVHIWPKESPKTISKHEGERQRVLKSLEQGPLTVSRLQALSDFSSRAYFLKKVINPLVDEGLIEKVGDKYSPVCVYRLKKA